MKDKVLAVLKNTDGYVSGQELCEELRDGEPERELKPLLDEVAAAYQKVLGIVERLD